MKKPFREKQNIYRHEISRNQKRFILIPIVSLFILGLLFSIGDDIVFFATKKDATAKIIDIRRVNDPRPFVFKLAYYNEYERSTVTTTVKDIGGKFGEEVVSNKEGTLDIYYQRLFPKAIYIKDYNYPHIGDLVFLIFVLLIMLFALWIFSR